MNTAQHPDQSLPTSLYLPLAHWAAGFEYTFGFQIKLIWDFWGLSDDQR